MGRRAHLHRRLGPFTVLVAVVAGALCGSGSAADPALARRLEQALQVPHVDPSRTAALAIDLRSGEAVYSRNASLSLQPASNEKVPVAYAALTALGPAHRFHTEVIGTGLLVGDVWRGRIYLRGFGDPSLSQSDLDALAANIVAQGIRRIDGAVVGDESWFDSRRTGPGWRPRFYLGESPPLSALVVDRGRYRGQTSRNPALAAASLFRAALEARGIRVTKRSSVGVPIGTGVSLARDVSEPLARIVREMGRQSDNFTAEILVKQLGVALAQRGTTAAGTRVMGQLLAQAAVPLAGVRLADGSGLSRLNRMTATALVALLRAGGTDPTIRDAFLGSLAVAGVNGTLEDRMESRPARSRVIAKTGTTRLASALSGFVRGRYVFAVIQNGAPVSTYWTQRAQDSFATVLAGAP